jgi:release factor glutamine methyltransferase
MISELARSRRVLLAATTGLLADARIPEPRREAVRLWGELAGGHPGEALLRPEEPADPGFGARLLEAARRRATGEPLAHVAGRIGFRRLILRADRRALIPRPETEGLVDLLLARVRGGRVADVGTGGGALALSLAQEGGFERVLGVDLSAEALALAQENRRTLGFGIDLARGDLCAPIAAEALDALVSNPPYLTDREYATLDPSVRAWEPRAALAGGPDGMAATARLLDDGRRVLRPGGWVALEIDCTRAGDCARLAGELGWHEIAIHADLFGRERYLLARRSTTP